MLKSIFYEPAQFSGGCMHAFSAFVVNLENFAFFYQWDNWYYPVISLYSTPMTRTLVCHDMMCGYTINHATFHFPRFSSIYFPDFPTWLLGRSSVTTWWAGILRTDSSNLPTRNIFIDWFCQEIISTPISPDFSPIFSLIAHLSDKDHMRARVGQDIIYWQLLFLWDGSDPW